MHWQDPGRLFDRETDINADADFNGTGGEGTLDLVGLNLSAVIEGNTVAERRTPEGITALELAVDVQAQSPAVKNAGNVDRFIPPGSMRAT